MLLRSFSVDIYCWVHGQAVRVVYFFRRNPLDKLKFLFASDYELERASELGIGTCVLLI